MSSAKDFLTAVGRDLDKRVNVEKWEDLFLMRRNDFKKLGVNVQDRKWVVLRSLCLNSVQLFLTTNYRYVMWAMQKYRFGIEPQAFAHPVKPKKKIRGCVDEARICQTKAYCHFYHRHGPRVQLGKRIRWTLLEHEFGRVHNSASDVFLERIVKW